MITKQEIWFPTFGPVWGANIAHRVWAKEARLLLSDGAPSYRADLHKALSFWEKLATKVPFAAGQKSASSI